MSIDFSKPVRTRNGHEVVIFGTDFDGTFPVRGYTVGESPKIVRSWKLDGSYVWDGTSTHDLVQEKPRVKRKVFINVYKDYTFVYGSFAEANHQATLGRIACVEINIDVEEGHGIGTA